MAGSYPKWCIRATIRRPIDERSARRSRSRRATAGFDARTAPGGATPAGADRRRAGAVRRRRRAFRRAEDRVAHQEKVLLARALDILASDARRRGAARRPAAAARRRPPARAGSAVIADGVERRAAVGLAPDEDPADAEALAGWLDANAPRSRARRAAAAPAPISLIVGGGTVDEDGAETRIGAPRPGRPATRQPTGRPVTTRCCRSRPPATSRSGFEFARAADADRGSAERLPPTMARHAGVALALITNELATERELATLRARDAERATFVSTVAHELRTPLTGLRGYLELILGGQVLDPEVEHDFLERSRSIVGSMAELVGDLLELSRLESGTLNLEIGPFSIAEAGAQVASSLLPIAIDHGTRLTTALPPRMRVATGDRRRVEQILTNLVANALKFTPEGGSVEIAGRVDGLAAVLIVRDDGDGIPAEDRGRIFERFQRLRRARAGDGHRSRPADRPGPRPTDGRRPGRRLRAGGRLRVRPRPARTDRDRRRRPPGVAPAGARGGGGRARGADRPAGDRGGRAATTRTIDGTGRPRRQGPPPGAAVAPRGTSSRRLTSSAAERASFPRDPGAGARFRG